MTCSRPLALLLLALLLCLPFAAGSSRAQSTNADRRFQFADTTLVRDTLGLTFERLFPLADSLRMTPDSLRAISVRYRWTLARLVKLADSLAVPIDSVGPVMERERFNVLATNVGVANSFQYSTTFGVVQTSQSWGNQLDYRVSRKKLVMDNSTTIDISKGRSGTTRNRSATTEVSWRSGRDLSLGLNSAVRRSDNFAGGSIYDRQAGVTDFGFALRSVHHPTDALTVRFSALGGSHGENDEFGKKHGLHGDFSVDSRLSTGRWLTATAVGQLISNVVDVYSFGRSDSFPGPDPVAARDGTASLRSSLGIFQNARIGFLANLRSVSTSNSSPGQVFTDYLAPGGPRLKFELVDNKTGNHFIDGTLRIRQDNNRSLEITQSTSEDRRLNSSRKALTTSADKTSAAGRYSLGPASFQGTLSLTDQSRFDPDGNGQGRAKTTNTGTHAIDGTLDLPISAKLTSQLRGNVSLISTRYEGSTSDPEKDAYSQYYEVNTQYRQSQRLSTTVGLHVEQAQVFSLTPGSAASSYEDHNYTASWHWTYLLVTGLTATQTNSVSAKYHFRQYVPSDNSLGLDYRTNTTLDAVFTPRFSLQVNHAAAYRRSGKYTPAPSDSTSEFFIPGAGGGDYSLNARVNYTLSQAFSVTFSPAYTSATQTTIVDDVPMASNISRTLTMGGRANLNVGVGAKGKLSGSIGRDYNRSVTWSPTSIRVTSVPGWSGNLQLTWIL